MTTVRLTWWVNGHRIERDLLKARACPKCSTTARVELFDPECKDQVELAWRASQPFMPVACGACDEPYALDQRPRSIRDAEDREQLDALWDATDAKLAAAQAELKAKGPPEYTRAMRHYRATETDDVAGPAMPSALYGVEARKPFLQGVRYSPDDPRVQEMLGRYFPKPAPKRRTLRERLRDAWRAWKGER